MQVERQGAKVSKLMNRDIAFLPLDPFCPTADEDILKAFTLREERRRVLMD